MRFRAIDSQGDERENEQQPEHDTKALDESSMSPPNGVLATSLRLAHGTSKGERL